MFCGSDEDELILEPGGTSTPFDGKFGLIKCQGRYPKAIESTLDGVIVVTALSTSPHL